MYFDHFYCADSIFGVFTRFLLILKICTFISFAYCGFTFFAYNMHVFLSTSMKFILTLYLILRNCSKISVFEFFLFFGHFFIFGDSNAIFEPLRPIQNHSMFTQVSIAICTLCFCKKKVQNVSFYTIFL